MAPTWFLGTGTMKLPRTWCKHWVPPGKSLYHWPEPHFVSNGTSHTAMSYSARLMLQIGMMYSICSKPVSRSLVSSIRWFPTPVFQQGKHSWTRRLMPRQEDYSRQSSIQSTSILSVIFMWSDARITFSAKNLVKGTRSWLMLLQPHLLTRRLWTYIPHARPGSLGWCDHLRVYWFTRISRLTSLRRGRRVRQTLTILSVFITVWKLNINHYSSATSMVPTFLEKIWDSLPWSQSEDVAVALLMPVVRPEINGKAFFTAGQQIVEFEDAIRQTQPQWMGEQLSKDVEEGQSRLRQAGVWPILNKQYNKTQLYDGNLTS